MEFEKEKIKAIIFDWGGVCCREGEPFASVSLQKAAGMNPNQIQSVVSDIYHDYYCGQVDRDTFWLTVLQHLNLQSTLELNPEALSASYLSSYVVYEEVLEKALELKKKYRVGLFSNLTPEMRDHIRRAHSLEKIFDAEVYSCDAAVRAMKPETAPYETALAKLGALPSEAFFIDNSPKNIAVARELGWQAALCTDAIQVLQALGGFLGTDSN
ncbi:MAG: uncharacterized protein HW383_679 [Candidatus Magasanikbacteria bacterium]|nr:uncharacterized protein [Candidatus Magasanikbacteria bacterium]